LGHTGLDGRAKICLSRFDGETKRCGVTMGLRGVGSLYKWREEARDGTGAAGGINRAACDAYASDPPPIVWPGLHESMQRGCEEYWDGPDGYDAPTPPGEETPFEGGQCPGVAYTVFQTIVSVTTGQTVESSVGSYIGPVSISTPTNPLNSVGDPFEKLWRYTINEGRSDEQTYQAPSEEAPTFRVERGDGLPDDCGNPPGSPIPPVPGNPPPSTGFGDPRDIGEPGSPFIVTPGPIVIGPDGPSMPFDTPIGPVYVWPDKEDPVPPPPPPVEGEPFDVSGGGDVDADPEEPDYDEDGRTLIGYRWSVLDSAPQFQSVIPGTDPLVYSRIVGSLQLKLESDAGTIFSDNLQITSQEGSIIKSHPSLKVRGIAYNVLPALDGLTLREIRGKDYDG